MFAQMALSFRLLASMLMATLVVWPSGCCGAPAGCVDGLRARLVVIGSSTAEGVGPIDIEDSWVHVLRRAARALDPQVDVVNLARGGYSTYQLMPTGSMVPVGRPSPDGGRNVTEAIALAPLVAIINLPSNDTVIGLPAAEQIVNFKRLVSGLRAASIEVWVATTQPRNLEEAGRQVQVEVRDGILEFAGGRSLDFWSKLALADGTINPLYDCGDGVHLNAAGHAILAERVLASGVLGAFRSR